MLDVQTFRAVVENSPLVSIDICLVCDGQILLGDRNNEPLKGEWFTPGGRIHKNESWQDALLRISEVELGLSDVTIQDFSLMGIWDHFYENSIVDKDVSTHYVNLPHYASFQSRPLIVSDDQHALFKWFDLKSVSVEAEFHPYIRNYSIWLLDMMDNIHD